MMILIASLIFLGLSAKCALWAGRMFAMSDSDFEPTEVEEAIKRAREHVINREE